MPIYAGTCPEHGAFERILPLLEHPPARVRCTQCTKNVRRDATTAAFILKGAGFYRPSPTAGEN